MKPRASHGVEMVTAIAVTTAEYFILSDTILTILVLIDVLKMESRSGVEFDLEVVYIASREMMTLSLRYRQ